MIIVTKQYDQQDSPGQTQEPLRILTDEDYDVCPQARRPQPRADSHPVVVPPDLDTVMRALKESGHSEWKSPAIPADSPDLSPFWSRSHLISCDKCGYRGLQLYPQTYVGGKDIEHVICENCDRKLFDLLDRLPGGVPETGYRPGSMEALIAQTIVMAFFSK